MITTVMKMTIKSQLIFQISSHSILIKINKDSKTKEKEEEEEEITNNMENLNIQPEVYLPPLSPE
jgi:hypothetical protein